MAVIYTDLHALPPVTCIFLPSGAIFVYIVKKPQETVDSHHGKGDHAWEGDLCMGKESHPPQSNGNVKMKGEG